MRSRKAVAMRSPQFLKPDTPDHTLPVPRIRSSVMDASHDYATAGAHVDASFMPSEATAPAQTTPIASSLPSIWSTREAARQGDQGW